MTPRALWRLARAGAAALVLSACGCSGCDQGQNQDQPQQVQPTAGGTSSPSGGGDVSVGGPTGAAPPQPENLQARYSTALDKMKAKDFDGANADLAEVVASAGDSPLGAEARKQLGLVQNVLAQTPATAGKDLLADPVKFAEKPVTVHGTYKSGGDIGASTYYFFLKSGKSDVQCRYAHLPLEDKENLLKVADGQKLVVRGVFRTATAAGKPYLDVTFYRPE